jgi:eukaryotic-like serine/threonine-protein kinase
MILLSKISTPSVARLGAPGATDLSLLVDHATVLYTSKLLQGSDGLCQGDSVPLARLGKYEILDVIGRGGMGTVYRARDPDIDRVVAIKAISRDLGSSPEMIERFLREAQFVGRLQHPNIVTVYDVGESDGVAYIVMEYLEGESLERIITGARNLRLVHKVGYMVGVCRGLRYAHQRHVVHRDIKPSNILITKDGGVKILDFGVARFTDISEADARQTRTGVVVGTLAYMSPEQISGLTASESMDIWAVGVTTYELVSL